MKNEAAHGCINFATVKIVLFCIVVYIGVCVSTKVINVKKKKAERTNSAIGDSVVDGSTIDWNFYERFDDLTDKDIVEMTQSDFKIYQKNSMSKNAW